MVEICNPLVPSQNIFQVLKCNRNAKTPMSLHFNTLQPLLVSQWTHGPTFGVTIPIH